jgi:hypothetical protein
MRMGEWLGRERSRKVRSSVFPSLPIPVATVAAGEVGVLAFHRPQARALLNSCHQLLNLAIVQAQGSAGSLFQEDLRELPPLGQGLQEDISCQHPVYHLHLLR